MDRTTHCPDCFQPPAPDPVCPCGFDPRRAYDDSSLLPPFTALGGGRYLTGRVLGEPGGFGVVYAGLQTGLVPMPVAIKEFFPQSVNPLAGRARNGIDVSARPGREGEYARWRGRFLDEARLLASLHQPRIQPRIVHVRDLFEDHGTAYLVMERLRGQNLAEHLGSWTHTAEQGSTLPRRLPPGDAWALLLAALEGLEALHGRPGGPVIHRDLTPNNLFLEGGRIDCVKLLDFGLAREGERTVAASSAGVGNPAFMPPEQAQDRTNPGERVAASDCYTLAASLYCALTGRPPPSPEARRGGFGLAELRRLPGLDPTLARVLTECLALDWRARPANAKALRQRLAAATVDLGSPPGPEPEPDPPPDPRPLKPGPGPKPKTGRKPAGGRDAKPRSKPKPADPRRRAARWLAPVLILAALTVGAGWWIFGPGWPTGRASSSGAAPAPVVAPAITVPKPPRPATPGPRARRPQRGGPSRRDLWPTPDHAGQRHRAGPLRQARLARRLLAPGSGRYGKGAQDRTTETCRP